MPLGGVVKTSLHSTLMDLVDQERKMLPVCNQFDDGCRLAQRRGNMMDLQPYFLFHMHFIPYKITVI